MMDIASVTVGFLILLGAMTLGLHIATVMFGVGFIGAALYLGWPGSTRWLSSIWDRWTTTSCCRCRCTSCWARSWCAAARPTHVPLAGRLAEPLPGGLLHTNVAASALFSAVSGSSVATAATDLHRRAADLPQEIRHPLVLGSIAAGASLGNLIPPGIALIVYGVMTNTSVGPLYAGGVIPGVIMTVMFMATIVFMAWWRPLDPPARGQSTDLCWCG